MEKGITGMIANLGGEIEQAAGTEVRAQVMAGAEKIGKKTPGAESALWVRDAIERLDGLAPEDTRRKIMNACGANCLRMNSSMLDRAVARRQKCASEEDFLKAEARKPGKLSRLEVHGNTLIQVYMPADFARPIRCFCALLRELPADAQLSPTYCLCSQGFVRTYWETVLGRPVVVEVLGTAVSGSSECRFKITI